MGALVDKAEKEVESWVEHYKRQTEEVVKAREKLKELASKLEECEVEEKVVEVSYNSINVKLESLEKARELLSKMLEKTEIKSFVKSSRSYASELRWYYTVDYKGVLLSIGPAEPNKDCIAVMKTNTYTTWVCEKAETT